MTARYRAWLAVLATGGLASLCPAPGLAADVDADTAAAAAPAAASQPDVPAALPEAAEETTGLEADAPPGADAYTGASAAPGYPAGTASPIPGAQQDEATAAGAAAASTDTAAAASGAAPPVTLPDPGIESIDTAEPGDASSTPAPAPVSSEQPWGALSILGGRVAPGGRRELAWTAGQSFSGSTIDTPIVVIRGAEPGPTLCLTAAVHGDELNGVEIVRRVLADIDSNDLSGTVIGAPIVNLLGFSRGTRYLPDRRDLNRFFPGNPSGSSASRIAHVFFEQVIRHCELLVDFHTGSFKRTNLPQLRADLAVPAVREFVRNFGATSVLHKRGMPGTLRGAAVAAGIPAVTFELGEPGTLQLNYVQFGEKAVDTLLDKLDMVDRFRLWSEPQPVFYQSRWLRAYRGGILTSSVKVGDAVEEGEVLGVVTNPLTNEVSEILSPQGGLLLGRALNQFVLPGFATFHIGIKSGEEDMPKAGEDDGEVDYADDPQGFGEPDDGPIASAISDESYDGALDEEMH